jgi:hypothetical protein
VNGQSMIVAANNGTLRRGQGQSIVLTGHA